MNERSITVLIADDHPIVRDGLRMALERREDIEVVAEAGNGRAAVTAAIRTRPQVAIVDLDMPDLDGVAVIKELARVLPGCRCLVLTLHDDDRHLYDALAAGAAGFLVKGAPTDEIERSVRSAAAGQLVLGAAVAQRVSAMMATGRPRPGSAAFPELSERELALLELLARDLDNSAIARALGIAPKTVRNSVSALLAAVGATDRNEAGRRARDAGMGIGRPG